jgi:hypothetical protein|tara:strand:+ start:408 stop:617 length:210 start_codon:yes stop_codon:yes gene_type:complete
MDYFSHSWLPYMYLYGIGGIFFFSGVYIVWKTGAIDLNQPHHRTWMKVFFLGYAWFMIVHGFFTILALQ